jgi:hypothetical protein
MIRLQITARVVKAERAGVAQAPAMGAIMFLSDSRKERAGYYIDTFWKVVPKLLECVRVKYTDNRKHRKLNSPRASLYPMEIKPRILARGNMSHFRYFFFPEKLTKLFRK